MSQSLIPALLIFTVTIVLVLLRPRRITPGVAALSGAALAGICRLISIADVWAVAGIVWNATAALIGIVLISALLDRAGFFEWAALHVARRAAGSGSRLFLLIILLAALVSTFFTNDGTVLILTPIVYETVRALGFAPAAVLAFVFACGFVADTVSTPLVVSNLVNIMSADYFHIAFDRYAVMMFWPSVVSLLMSIAVLFALYRRHLPAAFQPAALAEPATGIKDITLFRLGCAVVLLLIPVFFVSPHFNIPVSLVVGVAAAVLLAAGHVNGTFRAGDVVRKAPWDVIGFALGMYLVVYALRNAGLVTLLAQLVEGAAQGGLAWGVFVTGTLAAALSSVMNNLPATMTGVLTIDSLELAPAWREALALANVLGSDIGPKMTPIGSLATLIWLHELQKRQVAIDWKTYLRVGLVITPPVLLAALAALVAVCLPGVA